MFGILGGKKKNGDFFLELKKESNESVPSAKSEPVSVSNNGAQTAPTTQPDTSVKEENGKVKEVKSKSAKSAKSKATAAKKKAEKEAVKEVAPAANQILPTAKKVEEEPKETAFASKYLIPKSDGMRRRPGANMNSFLDMAAKVKTPIQK